MRNVDPWYNTSDKQNATLEYVSIALLGACNLDCIFCYVDGSRAGVWGMEDLLPVIDEAHTLGMRKIQLSGGEPLMYPDLGRLLGHLTGLSVEILLVTNATLVTQEIAELLAEHRVRVGISMESIDAGVSDQLSGVPGTHARKLQGLTKLQAAGYTQSEGLNLNIIMKTLAQNYPSYIETWRWAKAQGIQPVLDRAIPGERCNSEWVLGPRQLRHLMDEIGKVEGVHHRIPFVNNEGCNRMGSSVHIEVNGSVQPCGGIPVSMGNLKRDDLTSIWHTSEIAKELKNHRAMLKGCCKSCKEAQICYGCRAVAYATSGDMFGPDTNCWNCDR